MNRQIILGMGAGQCGTRLLAEILDKQPNTRVTHENPPLLPWHVDENAGGIGERFKRFLNARKEFRVGDVASFYLPYVEEALREEGEIRIIGLRRPREEVVVSYCRFLDETTPVPTDHWAKVLPPGWYYDPIWSPVFPKYDVQSREEGIGCYWDEYYTRLDDLVRRYPGNVRVWDTEVLTSDDGVREVLSFARIPRDEQVIVIGKRSTPADASAGSPQPARHRRYAHPLDPRKCVILVPFTGFIHQECDDALKELERRGYAVRRVGGYAAIDQGRNQMATDALLDGFEETLWIDSDVAFHPDSVDKIRSHPHPIVCGIYPQKGRKALACHIVPGTPSMVFGQRGGLVEMLYAGAGFLFIRREVYLTIQHKLNLPICNERFGHPTIPFFHPMVRTIEDGYWYLAEDYAFCQRARQCGFTIYADTSIRLWHIGYYRYGWEEAGMDRQRFGSFTLNFGDAPGTARETQTERPPNLANFAMQYTWPPQKPDVPPLAYRQDPTAEFREFLLRSMPKTAKVFLELGAGIGHLTQFLANLSPWATVIAVDGWVSTQQPSQDLDLVTTESRRYETFLSECWNLRDRIVPVKTDSVEALPRIAEAGFDVDLVLFSADEVENMADRLKSVLDLFPRAGVLGSNFNHESTRAGLEIVAREIGVTIEVCGSGWKVLRPVSTDETHGHH